MMNLAKNMSTGSLQSLPEYELEDFENVAKLGMGFFSNVYLAKYQNIRVVKKVAKMDENGASEKQLENERRILRLTDHENIVNMVAELPEIFSIMI
jgi:predicted Ser/Thr protein kinase